MLIRIWKSGFVNDKKDEYLHFVKTYSIPMFQKQKGIREVTVLINEDTTMAITYWNSLQGIRNMEKNSLYIDTVEKIKNAGFLKEPQSVEIFESLINRLNFKK